MNKTATLTEAPAAMSAVPRYIVRDSDGAVYLGDHGIYKNTVTWCRCIFLDGKEIDSLRMRRDFETGAEAEAFSKILFEQFQGPAFDELSRTFYQNDKGLMDYHEQEYRSYTTGKVVAPGEVEDL